MSVLVLMLLCLCAASSTTCLPDGSRCDLKGVQSCICSHELWGVIDLRKSANWDGTPRLVQQMRLHATHDCSSQS